MKFLTGLKWWWKPPAEQEVKNLLETSHVNTISSGNRIATDLKKTSGIGKRFFRKTIDLSQTIEILHSIASNMDDKITSTEKHHERSIIRFEKLDKELNDLLELKEEK